MRFQVSGFRFQKKRRGYVQLTRSADIRHLTSSRAGFVLIEALVATAILSFVLASGLAAFLLSLRSSLGNGAEVQSAFLAEEGLEAARIMRDSGWSVYISSQTSGTPFYIAFDGTTWGATTANVYIDNAFERTVTFSNVYRDANQNITTNGGTLDANTKKVTSSVSWRTQSGTTTRSLSTYLTNVFDN